MSQQTRSQPLDWVPYVSGIIVLLFVVGGMAGLLYTTSFVAGPPQPRVEWAVSTSPGDALAELFSRTELVAERNGFDDYRGLGWKWSAHPVTKGTRHEWRRAGQDMLVLQLPARFEEMANPVDVRISWVKNGRGTLTNDDWRQVGAINQSIRTFFYDTAIMTVHPAEYTSAEDLCHHAMATNTPLPLDSVERAGIDTHPGCTAFVMASR